MMKAIRRWFERRERTDPPKVKPCPHCGYYCNDKSMFCIPPMTAEEEKEQLDRMDTQEEKKKEMTEAERAWRDWYERQKSKTT